MKRADSTCLNRKSYLLNQVWHCDSLKYRQTAKPISSAIFQGGNFQFSNSHFLGLNPLSGVALPLPGEQIEKSFSV